MTSENCKICNALTQHWGIANNNKSLVPLGYDVNYVKCTQCGFVQTNHFDHWTKQDYAESIYNDKYIIVDPEFDGTRSKRDVLWFANNYCKNKELAILDYGCGEGHFVNGLTERGYNIEGWDTMYKHPLPTKKYDLITSFEVFEHTPTPLDTLKEILSMLKPNGVLFFTTLVNDIIPSMANPAEFWYIAPRNGHVCMHSYKSIDTLFSQVSMVVRHEGPSFHEARYV